MRKATRIAASECMLGFGYTMSDDCSSIGGVLAGVVLEGEGDTVSRSLDCAELNPTVALAALVCIERAPGR